DRPLAAPGGAARGGAGDSAGPRPGALDRGDRRVLVVRQKQDEHRVAGDPPSVGDRWGCLIQDRASRMIVAHASSAAHSAALAAEAVALVQARTGGRAFGWCGDG